MSETALRDLWPDDVVVTDIQSPATILQYQAGQLRQRTKGLIEAEVETVQEENKVTHFFNLVVPALDRYRYRLFSVSHATDLVYPATVSGSSNRPFEAAMMKMQAQPTASGQEEFVKQIAERLGSAEVRSVIHSLIAKINERRSGATSSNVAT